MTKITKTKLFFSIAIIFFGFFGLAKSSEATNHYVREGATGAGNGNDWTNAWTTLPATLTRGDTYYIADGSYASYAVDDAVSGTSTITIKKATISAHGTDTGWDNSYGDGQAIYPSPFNILTSYVVFDGVTGSGFNPDIYGFKIATPTNCNQANRMLGIPPVGYSTLAVSDITISHVAIINCGSSYDYAQMGIYSNPQTGTNITFTYNYMGNSSTNLQMLNWTNGTITNNYFDHNWSSAAAHGQQLSPAHCLNVTFANNILRNSYIGGIAFHRMEIQASNENWKVYNNLAYNTDGRTVTMGIFGNGDTRDNVVINSSFYYNTIISVIGSGRGSAMQFDGQTSTSGNTVYNNLFYNCAYPNIYGGDVVHTHNAHYNSTGNFDGIEGGTAVNTTGDPFVDSANNDYHLKAGIAAIDAGKTLLSPFDIDFDGITRPQGSAWDIGAYEYVSSEPDTTPPVAPSGLSVL